MWSGVGKSGWPMPRLIIERPCAASALARARTSNAVSVPSTAMRPAICNIRTLPRVDALRLSTRCRKPNRHCERSEALSHLAPRRRARCAVARTATAGGLPAEIDGNGAAHGANGGSPALGFDRGELVYAVMVEPGKTVLVVEDD